MVINFESFTKFRNTLPALFVLDLDKKKKDKSVFRPSEYFWNEQVLFF